MTGAYPLVGPKQTKVTQVSADAEGGKTFRQQVFPIIAPEGAELKNLTPATFDDYVETTVRPALERFSEAFGGSVEITKVDAAKMTLEYRATGNALALLEQKLAQEQAGQKSPQR